LFPKFDTWTSEPAPETVVGVPPEVVVVLALVVVVVAAVVVVEPPVVLVVVVVPVVVVLPELPPLAVQVRLGTLLVPFQEPRPPKLVLAPAATLPS
jgi:hypothetical protein